MSDRDGGDADSIGPARADDDVFRLLVASFVQVLRLDLFHAALFDVVLTTRVVISYAVAVGIEQGNDSWLESFSIDTIYVWIPKCNLCTEPPKFIRL